MTQHIYIYIYIALRQKKLNFFYWTIEIVKEITHVMGKLMWVTPMVIPLFKKFVYTPLFIYLFFKSVST